MQMIIDQLQKSWEAHSDGKSEIAFERLHGAVSNLVMIMKLERDGRSEARREREAIEKAVRDDAARRRMNGGIR